MHKCGPRNGKQRVGDIVIALQACAIDDGKVGVLLGLLCFFTMIPSPRVVRLELCTYCAWPCHACFPMDSRAFRFGMIRLMSLCWHPSPEPPLALHQNRIRQGSCEKSRARLKGASLSGSFKEDMDGRLGIISIVGAFSVGTASHT